MEAIAPAGSGGNGHRLPGVRRAIRARLAVVYEEVVIVDTRAVVVNDWAPVASQSRWGVS